MVTFILVVGWNTSAPLWIIIIINFSCVTLCFRHCYYAWITRHLYTWLMSWPQLPARIKATTNIKSAHTKIKKHTHITSVPYPSEYLVTVTLFFPQCSHTSVSWENKENGDGESRDFVKLFITFLNLWNMSDNTTVKYRVKNREQQRCREVSWQLKACI